MKALQSTLKQLPKEGTQDGEVQIQCSYKCIHKLHINQLDSSA